jgi:hypothetical protein
MILISKFPRSNNQAWNKHKLFQGFHKLMEHDLGISTSERAKFSNVKCNTAQIFYDAKMALHKSVIANHKTIEDAASDLYSMSVAFRLDNKVTLIPHS